MSADFVLEMTWKSSVLAFAVLIMLAVMRRQNPSHRAAVGGLGLAVLAMLPLIAIALTALPVPSIDLPTPASAVRVVPVTIDQEAALFPLAGPESRSPAAPSISGEALIAALWAAGALFVLLRLAAGLLTLRRWTAAAERVSSAEWSAVLRKYGVPESTKFLASDQVAAPLSWGWRQPAILINRAALSQPLEVEAIIAHEAAHLHRLDWPRLVAARVAVALFWFNPLVWLLERRHLQDVEEAADAEATSCIEPTRYAQTLLNVARCAAPLGANSMACGTLSKRIQRVLSPRAASPRERIWRSGALAGVAMIAGPVALTQFVAPAVSAAAVAPVASSPAPAAATVATVAESAESTPVARAPESHATRVATSVAVAAVQAAPADAQRPIVNQEEIDAALEAAEGAHEHAAVAMRDAEQIAAHARAEVAKSMADMRRDMLRGADEMERGAIEMREGAAEMREGARKLRDPAYRAEQIRKAAARGEHVPTDQELIDMIPKMEEGARRMDAGVERMRRGAQRMREQARRS